MVLVPWVVIRYLVATLISVDNSNDKTYLVRSNHDRQYAIELEL